MEEASVKVDLHQLKVSKEEPVTPESQAGSWGCQGLLALIPHRRRLLQAAAPYRRSGKSYRHSNDNAVIKPIPVLQGLTNL